MPALSQRIMDEGFLKYNYSLVLSLAFYIFTLQIFNSLLVFFKDYMRVRLNNQLTLDIYSALYHKLQRIEVRVLEGKNRSQSVAELTTDIDNILMITDESFFTILSQIFMILGGVLGLFSIDAVLAWVVIAFIPIKAVVVILMVKKKSCYMSQFICANSSFVRCLDEIIHGIKDIRIYSKSAFFQDVYIGKKSESVHVYRKFSLLDSGNHVVDTSLDKFMIFLIYVLGTTLLKRNVLSLGSIFAFFTYSVLVTSPVSAILNLIYILGSIKPSWERFKDFMSQEEELEGDIPSDVKKLRDEFRRGGIRFRNITFAYGNNILVKNFTFDIRANEKIAIVGDNGTGKSTLLDILLRIKTPDSGAVLLHQTEIDRYRIDAYRGLFAPVFQESFLFDTSVENNVSLFDEECYRSKITDNLLRLFWGIDWDHEVGFDGVNVSGGEKQRILIARSILANRPIIIWDESNANLDKQSESLLRHFLKNELKERTVIMVTHNQNMLSGVDKILFLKDGIVHGVGCHALLYKENIGYKEFIDSIKTYPSCQEENNAF